MTTEQDQRVDILNSLLTTPHRDLSTVQPVHDSLIKQDPLFYQRLAAWYADNGDIRDHQQLFSANLLVSEFDGHRDVGLALLREMPPYQLVRTVDFIKKDLGRNITRSMRTEISRYVREREADSKWFDSSALHARKQMKRMYALCHIAPSDRAQAILFDDEPPSDSSLGQVKALRNATTPSEQAKVIIENKIPYRIASTIVDNMTPTVLYALIEVMSPSELINNMSSLTKRGALRNPDLKAKIDGKLVVAKSAKGVSALKSMEATKNIQGIDEATKKQLSDIADSQLKKKGVIQLDTALLIDKSSSMTNAIEVGKSVGAMISSAMSDDVRLYTYAFDRLAYPIQSTGKTLGDWAKALNGIQANGQTSNGAPVVAMTTFRQKVDQIVMITDEGENGSPSFTNALLQYHRIMGVKPTVVILRVPDVMGNSHSVITSSLRRHSFEVETYDVKGDYYSQPTILSFLTKKNKFELLMEIMTYELPKRKSN